jgi:threonine/homoserine/homoserine lactone efflux protein
MPKWMAAIDTINAGTALGLGFLLSAINPKNLLLCIAAGVTVADSDLDRGEQAVAIAVFILLAASTVLVPVVAYLAARERMRHPLDELKVWLQANNATVMSVLMLVIGVTLLGKLICGR